MASPVVTRTAAVLRLYCCRKQTGVLSLVLVLWSLVYLYHTTKPPAAPPSPWYTQPAPCSFPESVLDDLAALALRMHDVLTSLKVPHVLCYGTLWGALRHGRVLPWDTNIDFCAMDVHLANVSYRQLGDAFLEKGVVLHHDWRTGVYHVRSHRGAEGHLTLFTKVISRDGEELAVPGGWTQAVWRWWGQKQLSFPALLLDAPFKEESFHGHAMPVPHEGIELLKYLYPNDWWLVVKPQGCA